MPVPGRVFTVPIADLRYDPADHDGPPDFDHLLDVWATGDPRPIVVTAHPRDGWLISNGRHRWIHALLTGQRYVVAEKRAW